MIEIKKYVSENKNTWNQYVDNSKNATFLFKREYMDYHSNRFEDYSLLIYQKNKLLCLLPANRIDDILYSHQGLTYGGLITNSKTTVVDVLNVFTAINVFLKKEGFSKVIYKPIPYIYHKIPSQEDLYALFRLPNCKLIGRNISSTIFMDNKVRFNESRKSGIRKAIFNNVRIEKSNDFDLFWDILNTNLINKYGVKPVHTLDEIKLLQSRFPQNIALYLAYKDCIPLGGTLLYIMDNLIHTQYISANLLGKEIGALDLLFDFLINTEFSKYIYFDFGQSTEQNGEYLNDALIFQKEGFGGRGVIYDTYEYEL